MVKDVDIRPMEIQDLPSVKSIDELVTGKERSPSWLESAEALWFTHRPVVNYVAEAQGLVIGFLLGDIRGTDYGLPFGGWIDMIGILPEYRREGIAKRLVEAFRSRCAENKVTLRVIFREDDERLFRFFSALGFKRGELICFEA